MNIIQIGANRANDDLTKMIGKTQPSKFIIVEPMSIHNESIEACYSWIENKVLENIAITTDDSYTKNFYYHQNDGPGYEVASCEIDHILKHGYSLDGIKTISVPCCNINTLISKHNLETVDILYIDAEGLDDYIIRSIDFDKINIRNIYFENLHLKTNIYEFLINLGYKIIEKADPKGWTSRAYKAINHFYYEDCFGEENWFDFQDVYSKIVSSATDDTHFVEVGSWKGRSAVFMAVEILNSGKNIKFDCVDTWIGTLDKNEKSKTPQYQTLNDDNSLYDQFINNIKPVSNIINPIKKSSTEAASLYKDESLDFVFIDACHSYQCVKDDIEAYLPKIKVGGLLAGHDIGSEEVRKAVSEKFLNSTFETTNSCWIHWKK